MQKVIAINLNGNAYQIDERGYSALVAYLEQAEQKLAGNPDRTEILADLEQAIAEKCQRFLSAQKTVVTAAEVDQIIAEMGPVERPNETASDTGAASDRARSSAAPRRLYLVKEGAMIAGVCNGLAAFVGIDATIVRIIFLILVFVTKGFWALVYGVLMFVIPSANTAEERAAAHGEPFNAQELIDRAKKSYADIGGPKWSGSWHNWRRQQRAWRRQQRAAMRAHWWPTPPMAPMAPAAPQVNYATRVGAGLMIPIFSVVSVAAFLVFAYASASLVMSREAFGRPLPFDVPLWMGLLVVFIAYNAISWPLHAARRASYYAVGGYHYGIVAAWDGVLWVGFAIVAAWIAYHTVPEVHDLVDALPGFFDVLRTTWDR